MRQTLFVIPYEVGGVPLFGAGVLLAVWAVFSLVVLAIGFRRHGLSNATLSQLPLLVLVGAAFVLLPKVFPGGLPIRGYGVLLLVAVVSGVGLAVHRARQVGLDPDVVFSLAFWMFAAGIAGARIFHVVQYWNEEYARPGRSLGETLLAIINVPSGGLVVYGAAIGGLAAFVVFALRRKLSPLALGDLIAPAMVLGLAIGRVGCLMNGCCFGGVCTAPWALRFPPESPPYAAQVLRNQIPPFGIVLPDDPGASPVVESVVDGSPASEAGIQAGDVLHGVNWGPPKNWVRVNTAAEARRRFVFAIREAGAPELIVHTQRARPAMLPLEPFPPRTLPIHPTQLYSAIAALLLCLFLLAYDPYRRRDGELLGLLLTIYPVQRFLLESIRTDESGQLSTGLSISQLVSIGFLLAMAVYWWFLLRRSEGSFFPRTA